MFQPKFKYDMVVSKKPIEFEPSKNGFFHGFHGNYHTQKRRIRDHFRSEIHKRPGTAYGEAKGGARPGAVDAWRDTHGPQWPSMGTS